MPSSIAALTLPVISPVSLKLSFIACKLMFLSTIEAIANNLVPVFLSTLNSYPPLTLYTPTNSNKSAALKLGFLY